MASTFDSDRMSLPFKVFSVSLDDINSIRLSGVCVQVYRLYKGFYVIFVPVTFFSLGPNEFFVWTMFVSKN